ncbi:inorganic phosphate transporter [Natrinema salsiterrestre]|uniref:Phosphate transporter n=1 Tax=Natrinema salsiterrestre TaxID=2950540 RepID=A0A9Q4Q4M1_9EURY|nr:inorganic phosphate transporter [Natrinema salsiterrestre]MDF9747348.1 anion permease [Natrinema salsiterrestre]
MVEIATLGTFAVAALASLFMAWAIGAGSSGSTPFAPAVGANAISVMRAGFLVGLLGFSGAVLQGANVSEAVGTELIAGDVTLSSLAATIALLIAAGLVAIGIFTGYPIATAFTVTGAVIGVGLAMGGSPAWAKYTEIATLWVLTPFVGGGIAYAVARALRADGLSEEYLVIVLAALVGAIVANIEFAILGSGAGGASIAQASSGWLPGPAIAGTAAATLAIAIAWAGAIAFDLRSGTEQGERHFLLVLGGLVAFSAGGSQVGLAIGPLIPLSGELELPLLAMLVGGGFGLLLGSWTGAPRMIKAISQDYSSLGPRRSIAALIPSFIIAQAAVFYGIPVSFNEIIVSAIIGSGYAAAGAGGGVSPRKMGFTVLAWIGSLAGAIIVSYTGYAAIAALLL